MFRWTLKNLDTGVTQRLSKDPRGYEELVLTLQRDAKWHGVDKDFTSELGFFCKGAGKEMIDLAYSLKGQEAQVTIKLEVKCNGTFTTILTGKLNFSGYRQEYRDNVLYTFLDAENNDIKKLIANREDLEVDLLSNTSLDGVALNSYPYLGYDVTMHSKVIRLESEWSTEYHGCCFHLISTGFRGFYIFPTTNIIKGDFEKTTKTDSRCVNPVVFDGFLDDAQFIVNTTNSPAFVQENEVTISWNIAGQVTVTTYNVTPIPSACEDNTCGTGGLFNALFDAVDIKLRVYFGNDSDDVSQADDCGDEPITQQGIKFIDLVTIPTWATAGNPDIKPFANSGNKKVILQPGDKIWYYWVMDMNLISSCDMKIEFEYTASQLNILSDTVFEETPCKSIAIHEAWSKLASIITDKPDAFRSQLLGRTDSNITYQTDGCGSRVAITSGKNIRRLPNSPIKQSLKSLFNSTDAIFGIGLGIENDVIVVEEIEHFYSPIEVLKLDNVPNIQMRHLEEKVYNEISLGFKKWQTNNVNGLDEPLTKINYVVPPIKSNKQKFEKISDFVAGMYAIELQRRITEATKDSSYDEDCFILALKDGDLTRCERNENMLTILGLISPETAYNLRFLLSSTFDRLKNQFVSGLTKLGTLANPVLMPAQGEGNQTVTYRYANSGCAGDHRGTFQLNGGAGKYPDAQARRDSPIWEPIEYTFDIALPLSDYLNVVSNPYGLILFSNSNTNYLSGWITNLEYNILHTSASFTLLKRYAG